MTKITGLPPYTTPIQTDIIPIVDTTNGITKETTVSAILGQNPVTGWNALPTTLSFLSNSGAKGFTLNTSTDISGIVSPSDRLMVTRNTAAPTLCYSFTAASSQYATKVTPGGITFTGPFTAESYIYLNSYTGQNQMIGGKEDAALTSGGFQFYIDSSGRLVVNYGSGSSFSNFISTQSIPLKQWVHVAAAVTSVASKTALLYLNGALLSATSTLTAATTLVQASVDLRIGAAAATPANTYFDGFISEFRLWSVAQSSTSINSNMGITLVGNETNLVALFSGNGNTNDSTSNGNNLTLNAGATASQASNPYHNTEFGIITSVTSSRITVYCGTDYMIPNMTLSTPFYSNVKAPYGFPTQDAKWVIDFIGKAQVSQVTAVAGTWYWVGLTQIFLPIGEWEASYWVAVQQNGTTGAGDISSTLASSSAAETDPNFTSYSSANSGTIGGEFTKTGYLSTAAGAFYYLNSRCVTALASNTLFNRGDQAATIIRAKCAYL